jgi:hypothetical protein
VSFSYVPTDWVAAGYTIFTPAGSGSTLCTNAYTFLTTTWITGDYVLRIPGTCTLTIKDTIALKGNLAIISDGSLSMSSQGKFTSASARTLFLMFNINTAPPCTSTTGISLNAQASIGTNIQEVFYTPCAINFNAGSGAFNVNGQIFGGKVDFGGGASITVAAVTIPGHDGIGSALHMSYRREIIG